MPVLRRLRDNFSIRSLNLFQKRNREIKEQTADLLFSPFVRYPLDVQAADEGIGINRFTCKIGLPVVPNQGTSIGW